MTVGDIIQNIFFSLYLQLTYCEGGKLNVKFRPPEALQFKKMLKSITPFKIYRTRRAWRATSMVSCTITVQQQLLKHEI